MSSPVPAVPRRPVTLAYGVIAALGAAFCVGSFAYDWSNEDGSIGSAVLPRVTGLLLLLVGLWLVRQELRGGSVREGDGLVVADEDHSPDEARHIRRKLVTVVATMVVTALVIPILGLLLSLTLMTLFLTAVVEKQSLLRSLLVSAMTFGVSYLIFVALLRIPLPLGLLDPAVWSVL
ncbi:tripartite tricarboxylate transporter TctB family protein [Prauserella cavernicola]|uniref:Tripartite tricarboxylate transporter TctB family protein n=1 Tax=Prauserella cavernicola TaxID=2800127 RepID=A0A934QPU1_9PSEU|nr:tripartite tricarboxylate transporter TctB family protein [Prauserella cavernicola]MBK1783293.1 tripartite tricarboxylate transporter TctB family protein [Prauserella cavernicola]